jgi:hypothetical protein
MVALGHATPLREFTALAGPLGLGTIVHAAPFHASVSVSWLIPEALPTAMQLAGPLHATLSRPLSCVGDVLGLGTIDQVETDAAEAGADRARAPAPAHTNPTAMCRSRRCGAHRRFHDCRV